MIKPRLLFNSLLSVLLVANIEICLAADKSAWAINNFSLKNSMVTLAGGLILVLGTIFVLTFIVKKTGLYRLSSGKKIKIIESLVVGNKEKLILVKVNGQQILIGATSSSISKIKEFQEHEVDDLEQDGTQINFSKRLKDSLSKMDFSTLR